MKVESVTQAVSNLALQFGDDDADPGAMVRMRFSFLLCTISLLTHWTTAEFAFEAIEK